MIHLRWLNILEQCVNYNNNIITLLLLFILNTLVYTFYSTRVDIYSIHNTP